MSDEDIAQESDAQIDSGGDEEVEEGYDEKVCSTFISIFDWETTAILGHFLLLSRY